VWSIECGTSALFRRSTEPAERADAEGEDHPVHDTALVGVEERRLEVEREQVGDDEHVGHPAELDQTGEHLLEVPAEDLNGQQYGQLEGVPLPVQPGEAADDEQREVGLGDAQKELPAREAEDR